ncbi:integrator complex subunit 9 isoform X3 [Camellia sinensis]|uniref:integrator complex subunit 9 isoform X3 n=1 Tax=Camellia sinensis TaxID=4442 RepID=UPI001035AFEF|nr:integrator complex subunit 9 isoform X3 [Camellia sinensis]
MKLDSAWVHCCVSAHAFVCFWVCGWQLILFGIDRVFLQTCLSKGRGFYFPPCHILNVCGFLVLLDCPLDLSALTIFSPILTDSKAILDEDSDCPAHISLDSESRGSKRQKLEKPLDDTKNFVHSEPCYKTVKNLNLWDITSINVVLISSPMGMLGLPFLTRMKGFSAKIYATEAAARLGQFMMEDLVMMHMEFRQFYGPEESSFPQWMKWEELEVLSSALKDRVLGEDGSELGGWMPLYSAADVKDCIQKVQVLKYAEETCYSGTLILKAFSSGLEIGTCNWTINGPKRNIACLSSSIFVSSYAMNFDYHALQGYDLVLYSDFSLLDVMEDTDNDNYFAPAANNFSATSDDSDTQDVNTESLLNTDENLEETEKLAFISSCAIDSVKAGGSVLFPIGRLGIVLQLLENISSDLESLNLKVPLFIISSVAEELLAFSNIIPEWLCKQRQEKLYSGEPLFAHVDLIKEKKLHLFPAVDSDKLLIWQEPCIVFCSHWSLRLGSVVHLLQRWCRDQNSLLVMEKGVDADLALLPFKPMAMKILQCSFLSGMKSQKVQPLLKMLQPKIVLFPEKLRRHFSFSSTSPISFIQYSENETLRIPSLKLNSELDIAIDLASQLKWTKLKQENINIARLKGELFVEHSKHLLLPGNGNGNEQVVGFSQMQHWGSLDVQSLVTGLHNMGINASVEQGKHDATTQSDFTVCVLEPKKALIKINATSTVISAADEKFATFIFEAICNCFCLDGI